MLLTAILTNWASSVYELHNTRPITTGSKKFPCPRNTHPNTTGRQACMPANVKTQSKAEAKGGWVGNFIGTLVPAGTSRQSIWIACYLKTCTGLLIDEMCRESVVSARPQQQACRARARHRYDWPDSVIDMSREQARHVSELR